MPTIIDVTCEQCREDVQCEFHPDGSVKAARCRCEGPGYAPQAAWLRPHWLMLRVVRFADALSKCAAEFNDNVAMGKCLCGACGERFDDMDGALGVLLTTPASPPRSPAAD